jgi:hypothetical protein
MRGQRPFPLASVVLITAAASSSSATASMVPIELPLVGPTRHRPSSVGVRLRPSGSPRRALAVTPTPHPRLTPTPARRATLPRAAAGSLWLHRGGEHSEPASTQAASVICSSARGCACGASQGSVSGTLSLPRRSSQVESVCRYRGIAPSNLVRMRPTSARSAKHDGTSNNNGRAMMDGNAGWWRYC